MRRMQFPTTSLFRITLRGFIFDEMTTNTEMLHNVAIFFWTTKIHFKKISFHDTLVFYPNECPDLY